MNLKRDERRKGQAEHHELVRLRIYVFLDRRHESDQVVQTQGADRRQKPRAISAPACTPLWD